MPIPIIPRTTTVRWATTAAVGVCLAGVALAPALAYGPPGQPAGQYTLGGVTTPFSNDATVTLTATADSTAVVAGTSAADTGSTPYDSNAVGTIGITIVDGSTTTTLTAGTQHQSGLTLQPAAISFKDPGNTYSGIGFGLVDTTTTPYTPAIPYLVGFGFMIGGGPSLYGNVLASTGAFTEGVSFSLVSPVSVASGLQSGLIS